jgi:antirestriction protein ArdC
MDTYQHVTDQIILAMETSGSGWINPMIQASGGRAFNGVTTARYNGINVYLLGVLGGGAWASYNQWASKGCQVREDEKGAKIVFFKKFKKEVKGKVETFPVIRNYTVFRFDQVDGDFAEQFSRSETRVDQTVIIENAETWVRNTRAQINTRDQGRAFYRPSEDVIQMPPRDGFRATETSSASETFYSTLFHELAHWTGHTSRLNRLGSKNKHGYAFEELIAEMAAAFQCIELGVSASPREDHAHYLNGWLEAMKGDKRMIVRAAAAAQRAVDYIESLQNLEEAA